MEIKYGLGWLAPMALLAAAGCPSSGGDGGGAGDGASAAKWSEIYPMIFPADTGPKCNFCHSMPASNISNGHLAMGMDEATAYAALVGVASDSDKCGGRTLVVPGDAEASLILQKLTSTTPPCGGRMPLGAAALADEQIAMVRSWIDAGAKHD